MTETHLTIKWKSGVPVTVTVPLASSARVLLGGVSVPFIVETAPVGGFDPAAFIEHTRSAIETLPDVPFKAESFGDVWTAKASKCKVDGAGVGTLELTELLYVGTAMGFIAAMEGPCGFKWHDHDAAEAAIEEIAFGEEKFASLAAFGEAHHDVFVTTGA